MKPDGDRRVRPGRVDPSRRKPRRRGSTREGDQGRTFRLETRAGEFTAVASLRAFRPVGVGKPTCAQPSFGLVRRGV